MKQFKGRVVAITGAGSGIGRALAHAFAGEGVHLALSDVDAEAVEKTASDCERDGVRVTFARLDVANRTEMESWAGSVVKDHGRANVIVNNAGVALGSTVEGTDIADFEWLMGINFWGVVYGTRAFLPHLKAAGEGHVVNISSVFGLVGIPTQSAYNAAKFGVRGFTESLRMELDIENCGVSATSVHPGGIKTNIVRNARRSESVERGPWESDPAKMEKQFRTTPEDAAAQILNAVRRDRRRALIGNDAKVFDFIARLPVGIAQRLIVAGSRRNR